MLYQFYKYNMELKYTCKFCNKECKNANSHRNHERLCPMNPERNYVSPMLGRKPWNKGLSKENDNRVKQYAEKHKGKQPWLGKHHSEETKKKLSINGGGYRKGSGRGKSGWYKGYFCDSSWELAFVIYNLEHDIKFERNKKQFVYIFEGKQHNYIPDWIVNNEYVEIKGYWNIQWQAKLDQFPKEEKLIVLTKIEIQPYIDYVVKKYGKNFIELYDNYNPKIKNDKIRKGAILTNTELNRRKNLILNSGIDLTKYGWVNKVSQQTGLSRREIKYTVDFYEDLKKQVFRKIV